MAKPDFRAAATVRLRGERNNGLSKKVLRLLNGDETGTGRHEPTGNLPDEAADSGSYQPPVDGEAQPSGSGLGRGNGEATPGELGIDEAHPDLLSGLASARTWDAILRNEETRFARYRSAITLVVAQLDGLDLVASRLGRDAADRLILSVAAIMQRVTREADVLARTGRARFAAMLPETDEIEAINYVERVRALCNARLEPEGPEVRLALGWAQAPAAGRLADALRLADHRMNADRRRIDFRSAVTAGAPNQDQALS